MVWQQAENRRMEMGQIVTPEEMAALFEELREAEDGPGFLHPNAPEEIMSGAGIFPEPNHITPGPNGPNFSNWLMAWADLRWLHL